MDAQILAGLLGIEPADLSTCDNPKGRLDFLASKVVEHSVSQLGHLPEVQATYQNFRPLLDGALVRFLGSVVLPDDAQAVFQRMIARRAQGV